MSNETAPTNSTHYILYSLIAAALFCLAHISPYSSPIILLALVPLLVFGDRSQSLLLQSLIILPALLVCSFMSASVPLLTGLAWILFSLGRKMWGKQRSFLAFVFLFLSAETLPFYVGIDPLFGPRLSEQLAQISFLKPALKVLGYSGLSLIILIVNFGLAQVVLKQQRQEKKSNTWVYSALIAIGIPIALSLGTDIDEGHSSSAINGLNAVDTFLARMSFFIAFFLLLFALVRQLLPKKNGDDRFT